jgi:hypothetical protein
LIAGDAARDAAMARGAGNPGYLCSQKTGGWAIRRESPAIKDTRMKEAQDFWKRLNVVEVFQGLRVVSEENVSSAVG